LGETEGLGICDHKKYNTTVKGIFSLEAERYIVIAGTHLHIST